MSLKQKVKRYHTLRQQLASIEREIKQDARPIYEKEGLRAPPRFETILQRFAAA